MLNNSLTRHDAIANGENTPVRLWTTQIILSNSHCLTVQRGAARFLSVATGSCCACDRGERGTKEATKLVAIFSQMKWCDSFRNGIKYN
jgi:hypothetical protein